MVTEKFYGAIHSKNLHSTELNRILYSINNILRMIDTLKIHLDIKNEKLNELITNLNKQIIEEIENNYH